MTETRPRFLVQQTISISDVETKVKERASIESLPFFSKIDPANTFYIQLEFGRKKDFLSAYVCNCSGEVTFTKIRFEIFDDSGKRVCLKEEKNKRYTAPMEGGYGFNDLHNLEVLPTVHSFVNGIESVFKILVSFEYEGKPLPPPAPSPSSDSRLQQDYSNLFGNERYSDFTIVVQGEEIKAHKLILHARSPYFERMFESKMKENATNEMKVNTGIVYEVRKSQYRYLVAITG